MGLVRSLPTLLIQKKNNNNKMPNIPYSVFLSPTRSNKEAGHLKSRFLLICCSTMANIRLFALILLFTFSTDIVEGIQRELKTYIVHVNKPQEAEGRAADDLSRYHRSFLPIRPSSLSDDESRPLLLYSYSNVVSGFAARLTEEDVEAMRNKDGFVSAHPERILSPMTTHTPQFLGLRRQLGFLKDSNFGKGIIIGMLDDGIFPDHPSFSDVEMPPPPARWKGKCEFINASSCNNKIIGARSFNVAAMANGSKLETPADEIGHGTHTASTAAGRFVKRAAALGGAKGTAVGMAPYAHLSIYKVCSESDCPESDILAGLDAAVEDGVDVLSLSLGEDDNVPFFRDGIAVASFAAMRKGIFVSCAAGNFGPLKGTAKNVAPWVLTVGASTTDRKMLATVKLGNQMMYEGESLYQPKNFTARLLPLVYAGSSGNANSAFCGQGALKGLDVKGKVVLCERGGRIGRTSKGWEVLKSGGAAMILMNDELNGFSLGADPHFLPATHVSHAAGLKIKAYINSTTKPVATILFKGTVIGDSLAPSVASFSGRGPNTISPGILKPDIIGPGVNIIAAWASPIDDNNKTKAFFNVISGTSMSCPHLSGIAALLKSAHPHWSPAAIKSAIMTSADLVNLEGKPILDERGLPADIFATGAGHINPSKANDPGLIYDIHPNDYIPYLCGLGYTNQQVSILVHRQTNCTSSKIEGQLNYPSIAVTLGPTQKFTRRVTNVGEADSSYSAVVVAPKGVYVTVKPNKLFFSKMNQIAKYSVTFSRSNATIGEHSQGYIAWVSAKHFVRSVISVHFI